MKKVIKSKSSALKVDFTDVEVKVLVPEGQYHAKVKEVALEEGGAGKYLAWKFAIIDDNKKLNGSLVYYNTSLTPQSLWNLRNLLDTLGVEVPSGVMQLDLESYVDHELMITISHELYEGKNKARVTDFSALDETASSEETEEEEEVVEEVEEEVEEEEVEEEVEEEAEEETEKMDPEEIKGMSEKELIDLIKIHKLKVSIKGLEQKPKKRAALVIDALEKAGLI